jgi:Ca-activated chloride channel homolog
MDWQFPQSLYLILPACIGWCALSIYSNKRRERARSRFVDAPMGDRILPATSAVRFWIKLLLQQIAIVCGLVAIAQPQFGEQIEQVVPRGSDLYVMIDVSRSMLADDVVPSRLGRAKADVASLVNRLQGERIGLIAFAGQAVVKCPLTVDYDSMRRALSELDPNSAPRGGTAIGDAIRKSLEVFQPNAQRDQAILLITDGDDQQSYPMEAAAVAAERKVTIFCVGLGDADKGARIPGKTKSGSNVSSGFLEHQGEQVWSKLDSSLLQEIAVKTSGVYVPAGTRAYDLGELYSQHLQGRRGDDSLSQTRVRKAEQFQVFLGLSLLALLVDLCIGPFKKQTIAPNAEILRPLRAISVLAILLIMSTDVRGDEIDPTRKIADGLKRYNEQKFDEAVADFESATQKLDQEKSRESTIAVYDEACAYHRKGDFDKARDRYLQAGLSPDRELATSAHFNLGMMSSEKARTLAGDNPDVVPADKRQEIIETLKQSIGSYRHCLELDPKHTPSRKNLELLRQWIKFYSDRWAEIDRQKRRQETNLMQFLEFILSAQSSLRDVVTGLVENTSADRLAELKQMQDDLALEVPVLKDKIASELNPKEDPKQDPKQATASGTVSEEDKKGLAQAIELLQSWATEAESAMERAGNKLTSRGPKLAMDEQQTALDSLDRIWDAIVDFRSLLSKEITDQSKVVDGTERPSTDDSSIQSDPSDLSQLQSKTLRKAKLLAPKAQAELEQWEKQPPKENDTPESTEGSPKKVDPEEVKNGLRKAIELAPKAIEQMEKALEKMKLLEWAEAKPFAEEAHRFLKEIHNAQPKQPQQDQQNQDQQQDDKQSSEDQKDTDKSQDNKEGDKKSEDDKQNEEDKQKDKDKSDQEKSKDDQKDQDKEKNQDKNKDKKEGNQQKPAAMSKDRIEEALRAVREREQEKRERDRELRARILGRSPVDKDW